MWWLVDQKRLQTERLAIEALDAEWFQSPYWKPGPGLALQLDFEIVLPRGRFPLTMIYHTTFPASPPSVRPADAETRLSPHQYGAGGDLCLDIRNDNWTPEILGSDMVESARRLLEMETPGDDGEAVTAPSAHDYPLVMALRNDLRRFYVDPMSRLALAGDNINGATIEIGVEYGSGAGVIARLFRFGDGKTFPQPQTPPALLQASWDVKGWVADVDLDLAGLSAIKTRTDLNAILSKPIGDAENGTVAVLLKGCRMHLRLVIATTGDEDLLTYETVYAPFDSSRSGERPSGFSEKRVGLVGLGSLGSKVAVSLARAGVRQFDIVDPDILHIGNLERHEGDWRDVGRHKADSLANRLRLINGAVTVERWRSAIGAQVSSQEAANINQALARCDMLIDATGNPDVFNHLAGLAERHNRDLVWGAVFAGGVGGEVARARFGKDPSPYAIRGSVNAYYEDVEEEPPLPTGRGYDGSVGEETPLLATDADIERVAGHVSDLALDTLLGTEPSVYDEHAYLIGFRRAWLFDGPFDTHPVIADAPVRQVLFSPGESEVELDFIKELFEKAHDEAEN